jgi:hypothetical protein
MGLFRGLNLLQSVEAGTTLGTGTGSLQEILENSAAQTAEFGALLSTRHMARRMAGNAITMTAITSSIDAINVVFQQTTVYNFRPVQEIASNQTAMGLVANNKEAMGAVVDNAVAWNYFISSDYYEDNLVAAISSLLDLTSSDYANVTELVSDGSAMFAIKSSIQGMKALVASTPAMAIVVNLQPTMEAIAGNSDAMTIVASNDAAMKLIANSTVALGEITDLARQIVIGIPSAVIILGNHNDTGGAWDHILGTSTTLHLTIYPLLLLFGGIDGDAIGSVDAIFADVGASLAIANSKPAMMAIIYEAENKDGAFSGDSAFSKILTSANLGTVLGSVVAIEELVQSTVAMGLLMQDNTAFPILLTSAAAKAAIFASTDLKAAMMAEGSNSLATILGLGATYVGPTNNKVYGTYQTYGLAGNWIILTGRLGSIVATLTNVKISNGDGSDEVIHGVPGVALTSVYPTINGAFTDPQISVNAISALAAGTFTSTVVDFN